jgi:hypothetical protein
MVDADRSTSTHNHSIVNENYQGTSDCWNPNQNHDLDLAVGGITYSETSLFHFPGIPSFDNEHLSQNDPYSDQNSQLYVNHDKRKMNSSLILSEACLI